MSDRILAKTGSNTGASIWDGLSLPDTNRQEWPYGYPLALGLMALTGVASFALFRWKGWF